MADLGSILDNHIVPQNLSKWFLNQGRRKPCSLLGVSHLKKKNQNCMFRAEFNLSSWRNWPLVTLIMGETGPSGFQDTYPHPEQLSSQEIWVHLDSKMSSRCPRDNLCPWLQNVLRMALKWSKRALQRNFLLLYSPAKCLQSPSPIRYLEENKWSSCLCSGPSFRSVYLFFYFPNKDNMRA